MAAIIVTSASADNRQDISNIQMKRISSNKLCVNLACGSVFVSSPEWVNLDFSPAGADVKQANLLGPLPIASGCADLVYTSHFLEHIPKHRVQGFLTECLRILKPGGTLRLVLPDLENLCREYMENRVKGENERADFVVLEMVDQCVRTPGIGWRVGTLLPFIAQKIKDEAQDMIAYVRERTGEVLISAPKSSPPPGNFEPGSFYNVSFRSCNAFGSGSASRACLGPMRHRMSVSPVLANGIIGCEISINFAAHSMQSVSRAVYAGPTRPAAYQGFPYIPSTWTTTACREKAPNQCMWKHKNLCNR